MREHHLEGLQPHHDQHRTRDRVRRRHHRHVSPPDHTQRQAAGPQGSILQAEPPQHHQPLGNRGGLLDRHLLPRFSRGPSGPFQEDSRSTGDVSHQALLHLQHAHHPSLCIGVQPVLHLSAPLEEVQGEHPGAALGALAAERVQPAVDSRGRHGVLHLSSHLVGRHRVESPPRVHLHRLCADGMCLVFQDVDRGFWHLCQGRGQAAPRPADVHAWSSGIVPNQGAEPLHSHRRSVRGDVHRCFDCPGRFHGCDWFRHGDPVGSDHHLPVLRDLRQGACGRDGGVLNACYDRVQDPSLQGQPFPFLWQPTSYHTCHSFSFRFHGLSWHPFLSLHVPHARRMCFVSTTFACHRGACIVPWAHPEVSICIWATRTSFATSTHGARACVVAGHRTFDSRPEGRRMDV
mmetsp:Transcript_8120/g.50241  ORF Transcript_8120/g.50241 Transcript_8120/m.50241 type:complete len:403 (-) Transcript_8120:4291-5499(-)